MVFVTAFFTVSYAEFWPGTAGFPPLNNNVNNSSIFQQQTTLEDFLNTNSTLGPGLNVTQL